MLRTVVRRTVAVTNVAQIVTMSAMSARAGLSTASNALREFLIVAYDGTDAGAKGRRLAVREQHLARARKAKIDGSVVYGGAILDDNGDMIGSSMVLRFASRKELDDWVAQDPYVVGDVWRKIEIRPFRLAPLPAAAQSSKL